MHTAVYIHPRKSIKFIEKILYSINMIESTKFLTNEIKHELNPWLFNTMIPINMEWVIPVLQK